MRFFATLPYRHAGSDIPLSKSVAFEGITLNYRHSFHAGNFADVIKHAALTRILTYLATKPAPFRVIDTHAGAGIYNLVAGNAQKTGEWKEGIGRLRHHRLNDAAEALLVPYRAALEACDPAGALYPGSPWFIWHMLRAQDRAAFNELHKDTMIDLKRAMPSRDERLAITPIDGFTAWKAQIPPTERRGLVLVDPPFEEAGEFERMVEGMAIMQQKWPTGMACLWYPIKDRRAVAQFEQDLCALGISKMLVVELHIDPVEREGGLSACGLIIVNPPWTFADEMNVLLPTLTRALARGKEGRWRCDWLRGGQ
jgi:23S rRNA (adenine2030-N6)-methyltransferase